MFNKIISLPNFKYDGMIIQNPSIKPRKYYFLIMMITEKF